MEAKNWDDAGIAPKCSRYLNSQGEVKNQVSPFEMTESILMELLASRMPKPCFHYNPS